MTKPELLAPAGSMESFHAAIEAGADAIYLGLTDFNARLRTQNFSLKTLAYCIPFAHKKNVKIYCAFNTLVKQNELKQVIDLLYQLEQIGIDALIVQDPGTADIARHHFPKLTLHASTQMVIHNSLGARTAEELGFKRVILSRECTASEIETIKNSSSIELEIFIHGALCYSVSGLCLASSYLGGMSGNRGRCTQVCRRLFMTGNSSAFYFSVKDLCTLEYLKTFQKIGIRSYKIEGRMKSPEYVYLVVSSYRKAIDNPEEIPQIKKTLRHDFGRQKTLFFTKTSTPSKVIDESSHSGTGILLGNIRNIHSDFIELTTNEELSAGDKIRVNRKDGTDGISIKIIQTDRRNKKWQVFVKSTSDFKTGDVVYLIKRNVSTQIKWSKRQINTRPMPFKKTCPFSQRILKSCTTPQKKSRKEKKDRLYLRFDTVEWLHHLKSVECDSIILHCSKDTIHTLNTHHKLLQKYTQKLVLALPPFIPQPEVSFWEKTVKSLSKIGYHRWMCSHISNKNIFGSRDTLLADSTIWSTNRATQHLLQRLCYSQFTYSPEDDLLNLKATSDPCGIISLFAYIPLFISRINSSLPKDSFLIDKTEMGFFTRKRDGLNYLLGAKPLCLTHRRDKLTEAGIRSFVLDFSFCPVKRKILNTVLEHYTSKKKLQDTTVFNHKGGLL